jgi:hypothetical protein
MNSTSTGKIQHRLYTQAELYKADFPDGSWPFDRFRAAVRADLIYLGPVGKLIIAVRAKYREDPRWYAMEGLSRELWGLEVFPSSRLLMRPSKACDFCQAIFLDPQYKKGSYPITEQTTIVNEIRAAELRCSELSRGRANGFQPGTPSNPKIGKSNRKKSPHRPL